MAAACVKGLTARQACHPATTDRKSAGRSVQALLVQRRCRRRAVSTAASAANDEAAPALDLSRAHLLRGALLAASGMLAGTSAAPFAAQATAEPAVAVAGLVDAPAAAAGAAAAQTFSKARLSA